MNEMKISDAAVDAAILEEKELDNRAHPIGYHVQQLLNAETEKLRKENEAFKIKNSSPFLTLPKLMETLKNLEAFASELVHEYKIDDNPHDFPEICQARKFLGVKDYEEC